MFDAWAHGVATVAVVILMGFGGSSTPPDATKITLTLFTGSADRVVFSQTVTIGVEWQGLAITIVRPLSAGRYHLQLSHGGTLLSDGRFTVR